MGYVFTAYTVDPGAIENSIASGDERLVSKIVRSNPDEFDDDDDFPHGSDRPSLKTALGDLITTGFPAATNDPQYRYAFEELCRFLGTISIADRYDFDFILLQPIFDRKLSFALPNPGDFPRIGYVDASDVDAELQCLRLMDAATIAGINAQLVSEWTRCLEDALSKRRNVLLTYG